MALTNSVLWSAQIPGLGAARLVDVTFDSSYPPGGEPLTATDLGLRRVRAFIPCGVAGNSTDTLGGDVRYNISTAKLVAFESGGTLATPFAEVGNTESLANYTVRALVIGA